MLTFCSYLVDLLYCGSSWKDREMITTGGREMLEKISKVVLFTLLTLVICIIWVLRTEAEPPALAKLSGAEKERVAKLIEGARKEGKLVGYSGFLKPDLQAELIPKFRQEYGFREKELQVEIVSLRTGAVTTKVTEELRAKVYKADIVHNSAVGWYNDLVARGEIMAYDSPEYKHFSPLSVNPEVAPANAPYFISGTFAIYAIHYNPRNVKGEITRWRDVLRPEYKGKVSCGDVSMSFSLSEAYLAVVKALGSNYFRELRKQEPFVLLSGSDLVNKAISGEYPIVVMGALSDAFKANLKGAGLKLVFPAEGWPAIGWQIAILAHAPHPNASKLFMDFYHSPLAQTILMEEGGFPVGRLGVKSKYRDFPVPIYDTKGATLVDWRKVTDQDRDNAREEFRRLMKEAK